MPRRSHDAAVAVLLAAASFALFSARFQLRQFGDSSLLVAEFARHPDGSGFWYHALYMPAAGLLGRVLEGASPPEVLRRLSSGCGALGVAFAYLLARAFDARRAAAALGAGLLALGPGYLFFSTQIEVHTLHAACVGLCALVVLAAPWRRPALATALAAAALPLVFLSHQSGILLGPGFVLLAQHARLRQGLAPLSARGLVLGVGPTFLAAFLVSVPLTAWMGGRSTAGMLADSQTSVFDFTRAPDLANAWHGWLQPLGLLLPAAVLGALSGRLRSWSLATPLCFFVPSALFFVVWGLPERGGYTLGSSMFLAVLAAVALSRPGRLAPTLGVLALVLQAAWGLAVLRSHDSPAERERLRARREAIQQGLGEHGAVISFNTSFQYIEAQLPGVVEVNLLGELTDALSSGETPRGFLDDVRPRLDALLARPDLPLALDRSYAETFAELAPGALDYSEALEDWLQRNAALEPVEDTAWPLVRVLRAAELVRGNQPARGGR